MRQLNWKHLLILAVVLLILFAGILRWLNKPTPTLPPELENVIIELPEPRYDSDVSIEQSLFQRRSIRSYTGEPLTLQEVSQLLWAA